MSDNLYAFFRSRFLSHDSRPALRVPDGRRLCYAELDRITAQYGNALHRMGLKQGDRVAVLIEKSIESVILYLACVRSGLIYVPLNTSYKEAEIGRFLADCEPALTIDPPTLGTLAQQASSEPANLDPVSSEIAFLLYTSGTTGAPKGAMMSHAQLSAKAAALVKTWDWSCSDVLLHAMPIFHTHGLFMSLSGALAAGAETLLLPRFTVDDVMDHLPESTVFTGVPTMYSRLLAAPGLAAACRRMRLLVCGSAALPTDLFRAFAATTGHQIVECWGMTELPTCASNPLTGERRPGSVGLPLPDTEIRIVDEQGRPLPPGAIGQVEVRIHPPFAGYWGGQSAQVGPDGFFSTGDLGSLLEDGYLSILGRTKEVIISGGYNIYPREIEDALRHIGGVEDAAVIGLPHPDFGEGVTAIVEGDADTDEESICAALKSQLAGFKIPKRIIAVDRLPRSATGKIRKNQLAERFRKLYDNGAG